MTQPGTAPPLDPVQASLDSLVVVTFAKNKTATYPLAVAVASAASRYTETVVGKALLHTAVFERNQADAGRAVTLLRYVGGAKGAQLFVHGRPVTSHWDVIAVLDCYSASLACSDPLAHCNTVLDDPFEESAARAPAAISMSFQTEPAPSRDAPDPPRYLFPCRLLARGFRFQVGHPASTVAQIQAGAVASGCHWCPHFDAKAFRRLPQQVRLGDQYFPVTEA
jgi:hypothetical protein